MAPIVNPATLMATMRVGQTVEVCMFGRASCTHVDQRFTFVSDAPGVVTTASEPSGTSAACSQLQEGYAIPCCEIWAGRMTAVAPGIAHVQAVLSRAGRVEKTAAFLTCPPLGFHEVGCRPVTGIEVVP